MTIKIGINGLGRIGRMVIRSLIESKNKNLEIKHINNRSNSETATLLLKRDSVHGQLIADLDFGDNYIKINNKKIPYSQETGINKINRNAHVILKAPLPPSVLGLCVSDGGSEKYL